MDLPIGPHGKPVTPIDPFDAVLRYLSYIIDQAGNTYSLDDPDRQPPARYFRKGRSPEEACRKANHDVQVEAAREFAKQLRQYPKRLENRFPDLFFVEREGHWLRKWMFEDDGIRKMLARTRFADVMDYFWQITTWAETQKLLPFVKRKPTDKTPVLLSPSKSDMAKKLGTSESLAQKYIQAFAKIRVLKEVGKTPGRNPMKVYSIGTWVKYSGSDDSSSGRRRNLYLRSTDEWKWRLRAFFVQN